jgi:competence ComEA-like helix-hairpin-helix protein
MKGFVLLGLAAAAVGSGQTLPDGAGKVVTEKMCTPCHGLENVVKARLTKDRWGKEVDDMVARGATGTDDEIEQVINYLATNFGPPTKVNVNTAAAANLASALGLPTSDAAAIVSYRNANGRFKDLKDLAKVPGIDAKKIESAKDRIEF